MSFVLEWNIEGQRQLSQAIEKIGREVQDWTPAFQEVGKKLVDLFSTDVFTTEGEVLDEKWDPLKPATIEQKRRLGVQHPEAILIRSGKMQKSFRATVGKTEAVIDNTADYFQYHQSRLIARTKLPRRVMMKLGEKQSAAVMKVFYTVWYNKVHA